MRQHHDMGGETAGPIDRAEHVNALWEKRIDGLLVALSALDKPVIRVDELRRGIEELPPGAYDTMSYYERWIHSIATVMVDNGVLTQDEIDARVAEIRGR